MRAHTRSDIGKPCADCGQEVHDVHDMPDFLQCSEFCNVVSDEDMAAFKAAKPGDFLLYPCPGCGCVMEDAWQPDGGYGIMCSPCALQFRLKDRTVLLEEILPILKGLSTQKDERGIRTTDPRLEALVSRIEAVLRA